MINFLNIQYFWHLVKIKLLHLWLLELYIDYIHFDIQSIQQVLFLFQIFLLIQCSLSFLLLSSTPLITSPLSFPFWLCHSPLFFSLCEFLFLSLSSIYLCYRKQVKNTHTYTVPLINNDQMLYLHAYCLKHIAHLMFI